MKEKPSQQPKESRDTAFTLDSTSNHNSAKQRRHTRPLTIIPLPPPPPPPPEDSPLDDVIIDDILYSELAFAAKEPATLRLSASNPDVSAERCFNGGQPMAFCGSGKDFNPPDWHPNTSPPYEANSGMTSAGARQHQQHRSASAHAREAREKGEALASARETRPGDFKQVASQSEPAAESNRKVEIAQDKGGFIDVGIDSFEHDNSQNKQQVQENDFSPEISSVKQPRPTSLFKPGQAPTFYLDHRISSSHFYAKRQPLVEKRLKSRPSMTGGPGRDGPRHQRKRRPLPAIPQEKPLTRCDVGVMTPDEMFHFSTDSRVIDKKPPRREIPSPKVGRRCRIVLLVVPSLVALVTSALLVLFILGVIGVPRAPTNEDHTAFPNWKKTTSNLAMGNQGRNSTWPSDDAVTSQSSVERTDRNVTSQRRNATSADRAPAKNGTDSKTAKKRKKSPPGMTPLPSRNPSLVTKESTRSSRRRGGRKNGKTRRRRPKDRKRFRRPPKHSAVELGRGRVEDLDPDAEPRSRKGKSNLHEKKKISAGSYVSRSSIVRSHGNAYDSYLYDAGSGGDDYRFPTDDEDGDVNDVTDDVTNSPRCLPILDPICDAVLPYRSTFRRREKSLIHSGVSSLVTSVLRSNSSSCDPEEAVRFICSSRFPRCEYDLSKSDSDFRVFPCTSWCADLMTSCLDEASLANIGALRHADVTLHGGDVITGSERIAEKRRRPRRYNVVQRGQRQNGNSTARTQLVTYTCDVILFGDARHVTSSSEMCLDLSSADKFVHSPDASIAPTCGNASFRCPNGGCLDPRWLCDGLNDCEGAEDENNCVCSYNEFQCLSGQCVDQGMRCDAYHDCADRSDEKNCLTCGPELTSCGGGQCILSAWWCDGDVDCNNGIDEMDCDCASRGMTSCGNNTCVPHALVCDGRADCATGDDEVGCDVTQQRKCDTWEFPCDDTCFPVTKQCDGREDCKDGRDEKVCGPCQLVTLEVCYQTQFHVTVSPNFLGHTSQMQSAIDVDYVMLTSAVNTRCHPQLADLGCAILVPPVPQGYATCKLETTKANRLLPCREFCEEIKSTCSPKLRSATLSWPKFLDCEGFPPKRNATDQNPTCYDPRSSAEEECSEQQFRCNVTRGDAPHCVGMTSRCDGIRHCDDGSDESGCDCKAMDRFKCSSGERCILNEWVCDGHEDCVDGSDEDNCVRCKPNERACSDYSCIRSRHWCDGESDCADGSDESDCLRLSSPSELQRPFWSDDVGRHARSSGVLIGYNRLTSQWHPLCPDGWSAMKTLLACNQMGFSGALSRSSLVLHHPLRHPPLMTSRARSVRTVQKSFLPNRSCRPKRAVYVRCAPRKCGRRRDVTDYPGGAVRRILGGRTSREWSWPWLTSLTLPGMEHVCGATLVRRKWLVSAAHCFQERMNADMWRARVGISGSNSLRSSRNYNVSRIIVHPRYDSHAVDFDIALVELKTAVTGDDFLCMPTKPFSSGTYCVIAGWGVSSRTQGGAQKLQEGSVHVMDRVTCQPYYPNHVISARMVCAGKAGVVDACSGDSGGPLMCWQPDSRQWQLAGVTSWGSSCKPHSAPGVYTDMSYFATWAKQMMGEKEFG